MMLPLKPLRVCSTRTSMNSPLKAFAAFTSPSWCNKTCQGLKKYTLGRVLQVAWNGLQPNPLKHCDASNSQATTSAHQSQLTSRRVFHTGTEGTGSATKSIANSSPVHATAASQTCSGHAVVAWSALSTVMRSPLQMVPGICSPLDTTGDTRALACNRCTRHITSPRDGLVG